jgi:hypothetical protein
MSLTAFIPVLGPLIDKLVDRIPDPNERAKEKARIEADLLAAASAQQAQQAEINKIEAANSNVFVSGWRPFIGWCCGLGIFWAFVGQPIAIWTISTFKLVATVPQIETGYLLELVLAMLGIGGLRTFEKLKGVTK